MPHYDRLSPEARLVFAQERRDQRRCRFRAPLLWDARHQLLALSPLSVWRSVRLSACARTLVNPRRLCLRRRRAQGEES